MDAAIGAAAEDPEKIMTNTQQAQAIIQDKNAREWFFSMLRAKRNTWQRDEAKTGLRAAIDMALGVAHQVEIKQGKLARDIIIVIDGREVPASFYFA